MSLSAAKYYRECNQLSLGWESGLLEARESRDLQRRLVVEASDRGGPGARRFSSYLIFHYADKPGWVESRFNGDYQIQKQYPTQG